MIWDWRTSKKMKNYKIVKKIFYRKKWVNSLPKFSKDTSSGWMLKINTEGVPHGWKAEQDRNNIKVGITALVRKAELEGMTWAVKYSLLLYYCRYLLLLPCFQNSLSFCVSFLEIFFTSYLHFLLVSKILFKIYNLFCYCGLLF